MTPEMSGAAVSFTRRTGAIAALLDRYWEYGKRFRRVGLDPDEEMYDACYPPDAAQLRGGISDIALEMIDRRREKMALDALEDLVIHLGGLREERKAVFLVSQGWALYRPNSNLARTVRGRTPGPPPVGVGPDGRLRSGDLGRGVPNVDVHRCDQDRIRLAQEDHEAQFRRLLDLANRSNASFYPVDPRGLPVFDRPMGAPGGQLSPAADMATLRSRLDTLQNLASATDGLAILNSNDIDAGLQRVVDDLSSYYLIGYYSTNGKLDGRFRAVKVNVTRPGVTVRTRRGYLAPTPEEVEARAPGAEAAPNPAASAVAALGRVRSRAFVHVGAGYDPRPGEGGTPGAGLWVVAELDAAALRRDEQWKEGAQVIIALAGPGSEGTAGEPQTLTPAARTMRVRLPGGQGTGLEPGEYSVRMTARPVGGGLPTSEVVHVTVPGAPAAGVPAAGHPLLLRRGPFSGAGWQPAADLRFRRQERVKVEIRVVGPLTGSATRLLDRNGKPLPVPVAPAAREEAGVHVVGGEVALAPLAAGDYLLETTIQHDGGTETVLAAFKVVAG
jgi:VWFA-related protein